MNTSKDSQYPQGNNANRLLNADGQEKVIVVDAAKAAMLENIEQNLIELMAEYLDSDSLELDQAIAGVEDPVPRDESSLHIRMAKAAFYEYVSTVIDAKRTATCI